MRLLCQFAYIVYNIQSVERIGTETYMYVRVLIVFDKYFFWKYMKIYQGLNTRGLL